MEIIDALLSRRSIRKFKAKTIAREILEQLIECGLRAPSSKNAQPWKFHVATKEIDFTVIDLLMKNPNFEAAVPVDPKTGKLLENYTPTGLESVDVLRSASATIYIENISPFSGGRKNILHSTKLENSLYGYEFEMIGIGAAIENILLAAHGIGLGAVFMGDIVVEDKNIANLLGMDGDLLGVIAMGYSDQNKLWDKPLEGDRAVWH